MLPQTMWLKKTVEEQLKILKGKAGVTQNVATRIAFFALFNSSYAQTTNSLIALNSINLPG